MTRRELHRTVISGAGLVALAGVTGCSACGPGLLGELPTDTDTDASTTPDDDEGTAESAADATGGDASREWIPVHLTVSKDVDVLFVVDNSSSTASLQASLAVNIPSVVDVLYAPDVNANFRIAATTTDLGNPWCDATSPEDGAFVATSCVERLDDFFGAGEDASETACLAACQQTDIDVWPTTTDLDPVAAPRPWLENIWGETNVPGDPETDPAERMADALACMLPQGINGCEYIAPLEAARRAIERARTPSDPAYGFLRDRAHLVVLFLTDGDDCSSPFEQRAIFLPPDGCYDADGDGDATDDCTQVFWTDPQAESPTPGVCWNAGVTCTGPMPQPDGTTSYADCGAVDKGLDGAETAPQDAVLHPVARYLDWSEQLAAEKAVWEMRVFLHGVVGVPVGGTAIPFATSTDPQVNVEHGIGPSCTNGTNGAYATPPVRLREVIADGVDDDELYEKLDSACGGDFSPALGVVADSLRDRLEPACATRCAADLDPSTPELDFDCEVRQIVPDDPDPIVEALPICLADEEIPDGVDACWVPLTPTSELGMSPPCMDQGYNLELAIVRREDHPARGGTVVEISCDWTDQVPAEDDVCSGV